MQLAFPLWWGKLPACNYEHATGPTSICHRSAELNVGMLYMIHKLGKAFVFYPKAHVHHFSYWVEYPLSFSKTSEHNSGKNKEMLLVFYTVQNVASFCYSQNGHIRWNNLNWLNKWKWTLGWVEKKNQSENSGRPGVNFLLPINYAEHYWDNLFQNWKSFS